MKTNTLKLIKPEPEITRVLPENKPKPLRPPKFEEDLISFWNPGVRWLNSIKLYEK